MEFPSFLGPSNVAQAPNLDQQRLMNWYLERAESPGATARWSCNPTPGVELIATDSGAPGRAHIFDPQTQREFAVQGTRFNEIAENGTITNRGTVAIDANPATISLNTVGELLITSGRNAYTFILSTNTFAAVAALAGLATMGDTLDGYGLVLDDATSTVRISDLLDFTTWDPTQFIQRSKAPDPLRAIRAANGYLYLMGAQTGEAWYNAGESPIPFVFHPSGLMPYGIAAPFSAEIVGAALVWVAATANGQGVVVRTPGLAVEIVSTIALANALNGYSSLDDGIGDSYEDRGHTFYLLSLGTANATWVHDAALPASVAWHERGTWIAEMSRFDAWRSAFHAFAFGEHRMLDRTSGAVYRMGPSFGVDAGDRPIRRVRRSPALVSENRLLYYPAFELDLESGLGATGTGQGSNPQVMLRMSNDNGKTWGSEVLRSAGKLGEYETRVRWLRCGAARRRVFEVSVTDPIPWRLTNAYLPGFERANPGIGSGRAA